MKNLFIILTLLLSSSVTMAEQILRFGIVPQQSASKLAKLWTPIFSHISQQSGVKIHFSTAPNIPTFEKRLAAGEYDIAYMNPYHYVVYHEKTGYKALNKARDKSIKGIIVVAKNSNITQLKELDNTTLAFPAPAAFAASILTRSDLTEHGAKFTPKYVASHDSVYRTVAKDIYPAGGGVVRTFKNLSPEIRDQLKILWTTKGYTPHAIAIHPRVSKADADKVQKALSDMANNEKGKHLLNNINIKGFENASNSDWDDVRKLKLKQLSGL